MKQQKLLAMFQPLPPAKPKPRNVPEDEEEDSDDDDWDVPLSSLGKKPSTISPSCNRNKPSTTKLLSKKEKENRENMTKRRQKKKSPSVSVTRSGPIFVSALIAQKLGEKRKLEQPQPHQAASSSSKKMIGKQQPKAAIPATFTLESELPDYDVEENAKPATLESQGKCNLPVVAADQQHLQVRKDKEAQTTGTASNDNDEMKAHAVTTVSPTQETPQDDDSTKPKKSVGRRITSSSTASMDYPHDPEHNNASLEKQNRPLSLIHQLIQRTTHGTRLAAHAATTRKWKIPSWIRLDHPPNTKIDHMAWDTMGVLLAVASETMIRIYDWDMVGAADNKGRNQHQRMKTKAAADPAKKHTHHSREIWSIPPVLTFRVPQPVASLAWNPRDMEQLAVGLRYVLYVDYEWCVAERTHTHMFANTYYSHSHYYWFLFPNRTTGVVHLYQVDRVSEWITKNQRNQFITPNISTYRRLAHQRSSGSVSSILFLTDDTIAYSTGDAVYCWSLPSTNSLNNPQLVWRMQQNTARISCMASFGLDMIVMGSDRGHLTIVNWKKCTKERAFSTEKRPTVLQEWMPYGKQTEPKDGPVESMGVVNLRVEASSSADCTTSNNWRECRISWVTKCGWGLSVRIDSPTKRRGCKVWHSSPKVQVRNADGEPVSLAKMAWSLPQEPVSVDTNPVFCWTDVPAVTRVLPHHNKYVVDSQPRIIRSEKKALLWKDIVKDGPTHTIPLPKEWKILPRAIAVHPSHEWIVAGDGSQLAVLSARG
jgi:hypothetical protein